MTKNKKTKIEQIVIDKIKEIRLSKGFSQDDISVFLNTSRGFIGQIESPKYPSKYNLNHLNTLAKEFDCSIKDFFPDKPI
ncbi:helix-turn-helix domain-containing protein [Cloacibacterium sp. TD35]|uniref:helix-turn-helix domain-containing protein n=1 Tax=Cloacibacterium sp. TD35 TaxID=2976818 RepID=UPI00237ED819|nr:helix-turn-helix transcriptional regulator [Cloacibacterium sp. TD35]WDT67934.1 helix-turn-helix domain-containing protein [Cloacibacterium sp. TD35]